MNHKFSPKKPTKNYVNYQLTTTPKKDAGGSRSIRGRQLWYEGHMSRACPYPRKSRQDEKAHGRKEGTWSALTSSKAEWAAELREQLRKVEIQISLEECCTPGLPVQILDWAPLCLQRPFLSHWTDCEDVHRR